jgi:hypothetical protein
MIQGLHCIVESQPCESEVAALQQLPAEHVADSSQQCENEMRMKCALHLTLSPACHVGTRGPAGWVLPTNKASVYLQV